MGERRDVDLGRFGLERPRHYPKRAFLRIVGVYNELVNRKLIICSMARIDLNLGRAIGKRPVAVNTDSKG
jgi:hypothetical protein